MVRHNIVSLQPCSQVELQEGNSRPGRCREWLPMIDRGPRLKRLKLTVGTVSDVGLVGPVLLSGRAPSSSFSGGCVFRGARKPEGKTKLKRASG